MIQKKLPGRLTWEEIPASIFELYFLQPRIHELDPLDFPVHGELVQSREPHSVCGAAYCPEAGFVSCRRRRNGASARSTVFFPTLDYVS